MLNFEILITATDGGMDVFTYLHPELKVYANTNKKFKSPFRDERTPSAHFLKTGDKWVIKDFGLNEKAIDAIGLWMRERNCDFHQACHEIADVFDISLDDGKRHIKNAEYREAERNPELEEGVKYVETKPFTKEERRFLCPYCDDEVLKAFGFVSLKRYYFNRGDKEVSFYSYDGYPIFQRIARMIDMDGNVTDTVHKIYQPRFHTTSDGKNFKFMWQESGHQPGNIINGLYEASEAKKKGLKVAGVICCGERDAICVASAGYFPIWFNSESKQVTDYDMMLIRKWTDDLYYIPDIDEPGMAAARTMIDKYPELKVVLLNSTTMAKVSDQHKACKDLRDYMETHPTKYLFEQLIGKARSYKMVVKTAKGHKFSPDNMSFMLQMDGFFMFCKDKTNTPVKVEGNKVTPVTAEQVRMHVMEKIREYANPDERDVAMGTKFLDKCTQYLQPIELDFCSATKDSQIFYTQDKNFVVTAEGIMEADKKQCNYVWDSKVINHKVELLPMMFDIEKVEDDGNDLYIVKPKDFRSKAFEYVYHLSNIHWQKEEGTLTEEEAKEQALNLSNTCYLLGYLMHRHKSPSESKTPYITEYFKEEGVEANGGTGKTLFINGLIRGIGYNLVKVDLSNKKALDDPKFLFQQVELTTDIIYFDECAKGLSLRGLYSTLSNDMIVEKKHKDSFTLTLKECPKTAIISNFEPSDFEPSTERRIQLLPVSHFFHTASAKSSFKDTRTPKTLFGLELWTDDYPAEDWNLDVNFAMQCEQYYLFCKSKDYRPQPPMKEILLRHNEGISQGPMDVWAKNYFINNGDEHCNKELTRDVVYRDYCATAKEPIFGLKKLPSDKQFIKQLKAWISAQEGMEFNPEDKCNEKATRRIRHSEKGHKVEYIYVRRNPDPHAQQELGF